MNKLKIGLALLALQAAAAGIATAEPLGLGEQRPAVTMASEAGAKLRPMRLPRSGYQPGLGETALQADGTLKPDILRDLAEWISAEVRLPVPTEMPGIEFARAASMVALRYRDVPGDIWTGPSPTITNSIHRPVPEVLSLYGDNERVIYLPEGWTGSSPEEMSVLVHELTHHMQAMTKTKFACLQEREVDAFEAQDRWLKMYGTDLEESFDLDGFTLLVRTHCI